VREALFGALDAAGAVEGARVLDLYAGTGALALEALSRGAGCAILVESARAALPILRANIEDLGVQDKARVVAADVGRIVSRLAVDGPFDLVFADPPWNVVEAGDSARVLAALAHAGAFSSSALVVLEHAARTSPPSIAGLALAQTRRYGDTALAIYKPAILSSPRRAHARTTSE
jgi:16S rRNA (guanine966-N2)-methyltransferase